MLLHFRVAILISRRATSMIKRSHEKKFAENEFSKQTQNYQQHDRNISEDEIILEWQWQLVMNLVFLFTPRRHVCAWFWQGVSPRLPDSFPFFSLLRPGDWSRKNQNPCPVPEFSCLPAPGIGGGKTGRWGYQSLQTISLFFFTAFTWEVGCLI